MKKILLFGCICTSMITNAQSGYEVSTFTAPYVQIVNATDAPGTTSEPWDDPEFMVPLGFEFTMGETTGNQLTQIGVGSDLAIMSGLMANVISYGADLADGSAIEGASPSTITYVTEGPAGDRIFKLQYSNCAFYAEVYPNEGIGTASNRIDFQIWLHESDNSLEYRFGPHSITEPATIYYGDLGPALTVANDFNFSDASFNYFAYVSGTPSSPTLIPGDAEGNIYEPMNGIPENGRVIRLEQTVVSATDNNDFVFIMYPTLATDFITVEGANLSATDTYHIYEVSGRLVDSGNLSKGNRINVNHLSHGMYILEISGHQSARKFMKN